MRGLLYVVRYFLKHSFYNFQFILRDTLIKGMKKVLLHLLGLPDDWHNSGLQLQMDAPAVLFILCPCQKTAPGEPVHGLANVRFGDRAVFHDIPGRVERRVVGKKKEHIDFIFVSWY